MVLRKIKTSERELIDRILSAGSHHFKNASLLVGEDVSEIDNEGSIKFIHEFNDIPSQQLKFPVEAQAQDGDGIWIHALLFLTGDRIDELEFYKDDSSPIRNFPDLEDWEILDLS